MNIPCRICGASYEAHDLVNQNGCRGVVRDINGQLIFHYYEELLQIRVETISGEKLTDMLEKTYGPKVGIAHEVIKALPNQSLVEREHFCCGGFPPDECVCRKAWEAKRQSHVWKRGRWTNASTGVVSDAPYFVCERCTLRSDSSHIPESCLGIPLIKRIDDKTGLEISAEEWERWQWLNVDTHSNMRPGEERYIRGRERQ